MFHCSSAVSKIQRFNASAIQLGCVFAANVYHRVTGQQLQGILIFLKSCAQLHLNVSTMMLYQTVCITWGVQQCTWVWFYPLCEMLSQNDYPEMWAHESVWMCPYSERVHVHVCMTACYRTEVNSLSLCVIWCSWLSSNLIWEHLIPRCLFPLCLISVLLGRRRNLRQAIQL